MPCKSTLNYSPNFNSKKRSEKQIRFIILHYTGMKSEKEEIIRLTNIQSQVASHYLITRGGNILNLVPDLYIAWHAGISSWKTLNSLNKNSIGIEITNPGHHFGYKKFYSDIRNLFVIFLFSTSNSPPNQVFITLKLSSIIIISALLLCPSAP